MRKPTLNFFYRHYFHLNLFRVRFLSTDPFNNPLKAGQKVSYLVSIIDVIASNQKNNRNLAHRICQEPMRTDSIVLYYPKNFYLIGMINQKLRALISAGIIKHFIQKFITQPLKFQTIEKTPRKLNLTHLEGVFNILLIGCASSSIIFFLELFLIKILKRRETLQRQVS